MNEANGQDETLRWLLMNRLNLWHARLHGILLCQWKEALPDRHVQMQAMPERMGPVCTSCRLSYLTILKRNGGK